MCFITSFLYHNVGPVSGTALTSDSKVASTSYLQKREKAVESEKIKNVAKKKNATPAPVPAQRKSARKPKSKDDTEAGNWTEKCEALLCQLVTLMCIFYVKYSNTCN